MDIGKALETSLPFWKSLTEKDREETKAKTLLKKYDKDTVLHAGRDDCAGLFLILSGRVRVYMITEEGRQITLFRLGSKELCIFSASCMFKNITFDVWICAENDIDTLLIPPAAYEKISQKYIEAANFTNNILSSRMSDVMWVLEKILFLSFDKRLAMFLLEQSKLEKSDELKITHEQIAGHLGSAREVVSRMLKYFVKENMIKMGRGSITLVDKDKLAHNVKS